MSLASIVFSCFWEPAINSLMEVEVFLTENPSEIVTIFIEDYVRTPKGLSKLFADADLVKFWYPIFEMPRNGMEWPSATDMVAKNHRLLVFTSDVSKEDNERADIYEHLVGSGRNDSSGE
ncbi:hypothetical protein Cni_G29028 [Canna indica]|uniref:Uncharacterized protein n=1 Tax=Canna indica TaxID=4628 RepID=A0AAQ3L448_9LILI|nr:hypothetical protein Cni_G29028 [Canna indica]